MSDQDRPAGPFPLKHHDVGPGLIAWAYPTRADGTFDTTAGVDKVTRVRVKAAQEAEPERPEGLSDTEWQWATTEAHRWTSVVHRFKERATSVTRTLTLAGCIEVEHAYKGGAVVEPPLRWIPHPQLAADNQARREARRTYTGSLKSHAQNLATSLEPDYPGAADALRATTGSTLIWLARAAQDLIDGKSHHGPRAFVQAHAGDTKAREDLARLLLDAGFEPRALEALGVVRNPYIGLGGPIRASISECVLDFTGWPGPHDLRLPASTHATLHLRPGTETLLVIENRQAAEHVCDHYPEVAVIWCHGQPADSALDLISQAARCANQTLLCLDADLGGVRIGQRIHDHLPAGTAIRILDVGAGDHVIGAPFSALAVRSMEEIQSRTDAVGQFARSCLARGYAVEQEASTRAVITQVLE